VTGALKGFLYRHHLAKLTANHAYVYLIHLVHVVLDLMPWFVRNFCLRALLARAGRSVYFDHRVYIKFPWLVEIGDRASINRGVEFYPDFFGGHRIVLGRNVRVGPNARFHAAGHDIADAAYRHTGGTIRVGDDVWIGAGALLLPGVTVGDRSVIGAGSVVTRDVPADAVAVGVPARVVRRREPAD
jgi:acetyltransferase-like isoleucine patch superfamily enzyme